MKNEIPMYVRDIMSRSQYVYGIDREPGYTIRIRKRSPQTLYPSFEKEIYRLKAWVKRQLPKDYDWESLPCMVIHHIPDKTHYLFQYAYVTIYDPIMKNLEQFIHN